MLDSETNPQETQLRSAVDQALRSGLGADEIVDMVAEHVHTLKDLAKDVLDGDPAEPDAAERIYQPGQLPPGLIDLPSAAKKYGIRVGTLRQWVHVGKLPRKGRLRAPATGGGYIVTEEAAIPYCRDHPRKRGPKVS